MHSENFMELLQPQHKPRFSAIDVDEFIQLTIPPRANILAPWLPQQGLAMVYAPRGVGKTFVALNIAQAVVTGTQFLNWQAPKPRGVLYLDGEMPATVIQERLLCICKSQSVNAKAPFRLLTPDMQEGAMPDLTCPADQAQLDEWLDDIELIIVDNISTLCRTAKENDADAWVPVQNWALRMRASGKSVLFIHHAGKGGAQRGTSKREDVLDTVITLKHAEDYNASDGGAFEVHFKKARSFCGIDAEPFKTRLTLKDDGTMEWEIAAITASTFEKVLALANQGKPQQDIAQTLNIHKSNVSRHLQRARIEGKLRSCVA